MSNGSQNKHAVITDTSCFILLDKLDALFILKELYGHAYTTPQIALEFSKTLPAWILVKPVSNINAIAQYAERVDIGEASAIALALEFPSPLLILDDLKGRNLAAQLNLKFTGTLGVLILAKRDGVIEALKPYIEKIRETDFRISPELLQNIITAAGE